MTRFSLRLPRHQARIVALAVSYHLARPGSELDPDTLSEYEHGLAEVSTLLDPQLDAESVALELSALQIVLLGTALSSLINELNMYPVLDAMAGESRRPRSAAPGFDAALRSLFPQIAADPAYASELAEDVIMLRRQLPLGRARQLLEAEREARRQGRQPRGRGWRFWRR